MKFIFLLLSTLFISIPINLLSQGLSKDYLNNYFDSVIKNDVQKKSDVVKVEYEINKIIDITPKKAIQIEIKKIQNKIDKIKNGSFAEREKLTSTQEQIKNLRKQNKEALIKDLRGIQNDKSYYSNPDISHKMDLIQRVLYEKSIDSTNIELNKSKDDNTVIFYVAQINAKNYYYNGNIIEKKFSVIFDLRKQFRRELTFEGFLF